ncbi:helix-turn-helix domain-containing protein [Turicibacter sp. TJ11]|uniref:helix-turn-helix domain-containing protein n=1 Tax=Turicibacter sp. TJ11 TaxID=2806443 RepID=UPI001F22F69C|nr:helix-turn-helix transcriptional regulator [Turicibacter sp. TJ11]
MVLGEKLKRLRKSRGLSQEQLAAELNVSRQSISKWELGESKPEIENLIALSDYYGVSLDYLLRDQEVPEVSEKVMVREVQPLISSGCLKKGVVGIVTFVVVWFILVLLLYSVMFIDPMQ